MDLPREAHGKGSNTLCLIGKSLRILTDKKTGCSIGIVNTTIGSHVDGEIIAIQEKADITTPSTMSQIIGIIFGAPDIICKDRIATSVASIIPAGFTPHLPGIKGHVPVLTHIDVIDIIESHSIRKVWVVDSFL